MTTAATSEVPAAIAARSPLELFWGRIKGDKVALASALFIIFLLLVALFAKQIVELMGAHPPNEQSTKYLDDFGSAAAPSISRHLYFGTDGLGRDVFSRTVYGAQVSLKVAFISTGITVVVGTLLGMLAGYYRGAWDVVLSRTMDLMLAFPVFLLALGLGAACQIKPCQVSGSTAGGFVAVVGTFVTLAAAVALLAARRRPARIAPADVRRRMWFPLALVVLGLVLLLLQTRTVARISPGLPLVIFVIVLPGWPYMARIIRGQTLSLREKEFVEAARSIGNPDWRIMLRHILPNLIAPIIVYTTLLIPTNVLFEAALSFLGIGVEPPTASWGAMLSDATDTFDTAWWFMTFPGIALLLTVLAFNLIGDGLQDAINPKTSGR